MQTQITQNVTQSVAGKSILLIEDTTQLGFGLNAPVNGIGKSAANTADGFYIHPVLVLDAALKHCYGLAHCHVFNQNHALKDAGLPLQARRNRTQQIPFEQKDSYRWVESIQYAHRVCHLAQSTGLSYKTGKEPLALPLWLLRSQNHDSEPLPD